MRPAALCCAVAVFVAAFAVTACTASATTGHSPPPNTATPNTATTGTTAPGTTAPAPSVAAPSSPSKASRTRPATHPATHPATTRVTPSPVTSHRSATASLPLAMTTGSASEVITVVARSTASTTATLQAWQKSGGRWQRHGPAIAAHVGRDGLTTQPSESLSATPIGSFTLTHAFGHDADPGTALPYVHTNPSDWWISQYGGRYTKIYNTMQSCSSGCPFDTSGSSSNPNEHLYDETPYYDYAVVIDYNTPNAGPVRQGAGSAFFLHVTHDPPTAGCVSIPMADLVAIMQWLTPSAHPRILIGVS